MSALNKHLSLLVFYLLMSQFFSDLSQFQWREQRRVTALNLWLIAQFGRGWGKREGETLLHFSILHKDGKGGGGSAKSIHLIWMELQFIPGQPSQFIMERHSPASPLSLVLTGHNCYSNPQEHAILNQYIILPRSKCNPWSAACFPNP